MSKLETNTIDTISGSTTLTLGGTNATTSAQDSATTVTGFKSTGIDDNATANSLTIDSSGNLQFNSGFGSVGTAYGVRAWVHLNASSGTPTIDASANISSITDNGVGDYTLNLTNSMPDSNYAVLGTGQNGTICNDASGSTTSAVNIIFRRNDNNADIDVTRGSVAIVR